MRLRAPPARSAAPVVQHPSPAQRAPRPHACAPVSRSCALSPRVHPSQLPFRRHADVLIHDAQYLDTDMPHKHGWGHSLVQQACDLAVAAQVRHLVLFYHDPERSDAALDSIQETACAWLASQDQRLHCTVAYEGLEVKL